MTRDNILNAIGPCSLLCYTCFGYKDGGIRKHAAELFELYKGWYSGHVRGYGANPTEQQVENLKRIKMFNEMLRELIDSKPCPGCRECGGKNGGCIISCIIPTCVNDHGVEFCAYCEDFPCEKSIPENIRKAWLDGNHFIKKYGYEQYLETHKHIAHYNDCYDPDLEGGGK